MKAENSEPGELVGTCIRGGSGSSGEEVCAWSMEAEAGGEVPVWPSGEGGQKQLMV